MPLPLAVAGGAVAATLLASAALATGARGAERFVAADSSNRLYTFTDTNPGKWKRSAAVKGLPAGEKIVGLDVRPINRQLYALSSASRLYVVSRSKGTATPVGMGPFSPALNGNAFGFDFNPTVDRIRIVANSGQNLRAHPDTGAIAFTDGTLSHKQGDTGFGEAPAVSGSAYTNSKAGATMTTLYNIDTARDALTIQAPPNDGVLSTVGPFVANLSGPASFDISPQNNQGYILARAAGKPRSRLFRVSLGSGKVRQLGALTKAPNLTAMASLSG